MKEGLNENRKGDSASTGLKCTAAFGSYFSSTAAKTASSHLIILARDFLVNVNARSRTTSAFWRNIAKTGL